VRGSTHSLGTDHGAGGLLLAGVLEQHLGIEAARVLPGYSGAPLQVIA